MWKYLFFIVVILSLLFNIYDSLTFDPKIFTHINTDGSYYHTISFFFISGGFFYMSFFEYEFKFDKYIMLVFSLNMFLHFLYELSYFVKSLSVLWYRSLGILSIVDIIYIILLIYSLYLLMRYIRSEKSSDITNVES